MTTKLLYYVTERGLLFSIQEENWQNNWTVGNPKAYRVNGREASPTFHPAWYTVPDATVPPVVTKHAGQKVVNERYELRNPTLNLPHVIEAASIKRDVNGEWAGDHIGMESLYDLKRDHEDLGFCPVECILKYLGSLVFDNLGDPTRFSYTLAATGTWPKPSDEQLDYSSLFSSSRMGEVITVDDVQKAMTPEIAWHLGPCSINSKTAYRIIRHHVRQNIDPRYAQITSDYDFCFTVKKKIRVEPYQERREVFGNGKRKPVFKDVTVSWHLHEVFEMTHKADPYRGYTPVDGFEGSSLADLADTIDSYLDNLMAYINAPLARCPTCEGKAVVDLMKLPTNQRDRFQVPQNQ